MQTLADVAELADAQVSEACDGDIVEVQVLSSAPELWFKKSEPIHLARFFCPHGTFGPNGPWGGQVGEIEQPVKNCHMNLGHGVFVLGADSRLYSKGL